MKIKQKDLAQKVDISISYMSEIINRKRRPSWDLAKKLATVTATNPVLWMEGTSDDIRNFLTIAFFDADQ